MNLRTALWIALSLSLCACKHDATPPADAGVPLMMFGNPTAATGLGPDQCFPSACSGFSPPAYDAAFIQSLIDDWQLATPFAPLSADPYAQPAPPDDPAGTVCAVLPTGDASVRPRLYQLVTYASSDVATAAGAHPTHFGHCGVCSTLTDLAVYMRQNDLTKPVRACAFTTSTDGGDPDLQCLLGLGFDLPCAQIWSYNTTNTARACLTPCFTSYTDPYNQPDGTLNPCLQCDEDQSGPVFKGVAGRTRRNSGLPNAICRPCSEVQPLVHVY